MTDFRQAIQEYIAREARPVEKFGHQPRLYALAQQVGAGHDYDDDVVFAAAWLHDIGVFIGHRPEDPEELAAGTMLPMPSNMRRDESRRGRHACARATSSCGSGACNPDTFRLLRRAFPFRDTHIPRVPEAGIFFVLQQEQNLLDRRIALAPRHVRTVVLLPVLYV